MNDLNSIPSTVAITGVQLFFSKLAAHWAIKEGPHLRILLVFMQYLQIGKDIGIVKAQRIFKQTVALGLECV